MTISVNINKLRIVTIYIQDTNKKNNNTNY